MPLLFLDKPSKPEGPLEAVDIHKEGCKLKWQKPKDDGGLPITGYVVEKMDLQTGRWVPAGNKTDMRFHSSTPFIKIPIKLSLQVLSMERKRN